MGWHILFFSRAPDFEFIIMLVMTFYRRQCRNACCRRMFKVSNILYPYCIRSSVCCYLYEYLVTILFIAAIYFI